LEKKQIEGSFNSDESQQTFVSDQSPRDLNSDSNQGYRLIEDDEQDKTDDTNSLESNMEEEIVSLDNSQDEQDS